MDNHPVGWPLLYETPLGMFCLYGKVMLHAPLTLLTYVVHVAELDAPEYLEDVAAGLVEAEPLGVLLQLLQDGVVDVLEDQEQLAPPPKHLYQVDQVLVAQSLHKGQI